VSDAKYLQDQQDERLLKFGAGLAQYEADIAALPEAFQARFAFLRKKANWDPEFGPYEMFVCKEAVKITKCLTSQADLKAFYDSSVEAQKRTVPTLDFDQHSGNTFGSACKLAALFIENPALVVKGHGALCGLVGCETYGCWASTQAAQPERAATKVMN
jgi:hypothetical protein